MNESDRVGNYVLERRLGAGSFATVWLATDTRLDLPVAIKVLAENWSANTEVRSRFIDEARLLRRLDDDHVVRIYSIDELDTGQPYLVMAWADRGTLQDRIDARHGEPFSLEETVRVGVGICEALEVIHALPAVHRDIKPSNILFRSVPAHQRRAGEPDERLLVGDLGLAKDLALASGFTLAAGTPAYMAPEQAIPNMDLDGRADIFATTAVIYELMAGRPAFGVGNGYGRDPGPRTLPVPLASVRPDLPSGVQAVIERGLALDPATRYQTAHELARDYESLLQDISPPGSGIRPLKPDGPAQTAGSSRKSWRRRRTFLSGIAALALAGATVAIVSSETESPSKPIHLTIPHPTPKGPTLPSHNGLIENASATLDSALLTNADLPAWNGGVTPLPSMPTPSRSCVATDGLPDPGPTAESLVTFSPRALSINDPTEYAALAERIRLYRNEDDAQTAMAYTTTSDQNCVNGLPDGLGSVNLCELQTAPGTCRAAGDVFGPLVNRTAPALCDDSTMESGPTKAAGKGGTFTAVILRCGAAVAELDLVGGAHAPQGPNVMLPSAQLAGTKLREAFAHPTAGAATAAYLTPTTDRLYNAMENPFLHGHLVNSWSPSTSFSWWGGGPFVEATGPNSGTLSPCEQRVPGEAQVAMQSTTYSLRFNYTSNYQQGLFVTLDFGPTAQELEQFFAVDDQVRLKCPADFAYEQLQSVSTGYDATFTYGHIDVEPGMPHFCDESTVDHVSSRAHSKTERPAPYAGDGLAAIVRCGRALFGVFESGGQRPPDPVLFRQAVSEIAKGLEADHA